MSSKKRKSFYRNPFPQKKKKLFLQSGMKGFFCTCNGKEKDCIREALNLLDEHSSKICPEDFGETNRKDIECELLKEIEELKHHSAHSKRFQVVETDVKSCVFIKTTIENPVELACSIFKDISEKRKCRSKFLIRLLPIEVTCKAYIDDIKKAANEIFDFHFKSDATTYAVIYNHRCNNSVVREEVIESICILVKDRNLNHRVDIKNPRKAIIVEIIKSVCCLSVVPDFYEFKKYNLVKLASDQNTCDVSTEKKPNGNDADNCIEAKVLTSKTDDTVCSGNEQRKVDDNNAVKEELMG